MLRSATWPRIASLGALAASLGCPGTLDDPGRFELDGGEASAGDGGDAGCIDVPTGVFAKICATAGCHSSTDMIQGLDLQSPGVASRVVGVCARGGGTLADPSNPSHSVIYTKLGPTPPFGSRMPLGMTPLDGATLACVLAWIAAQTGGGACDAGAMDAGASDATASDGPVE
jgi:hypothetical protein